MAHLLAATRSLAHLASHFHAQWKGSNAACASTKANDGIELEFAQGESDRSA